MQKYCLFYLYSENIQETCGPRGYVLTEIPRLFIVRYKRNSTEREAMAKRKTNNVWNIYQEEDTNVASQLVARYNGSEDVQEVCTSICCHSQLLIISDPHANNLQFSQQLKMTSICHSNIFFPHLLYSLRIKCHWTCELFL